MSDWQGWSNDQIIGEVDSRVHTRLEDFARTRRYSSLDAISRYQGLSDDEIASLPADEQIVVQGFRTECRYLALATARTWARLTLIMGAVLSGQRSMPSGFAEVEAELPVLVWPN
jgi:hypothetical protein